jgi:group I intron endonuclease
MFYYLYKITNLVNGKIYVGVHKAKSMDDGYMGSGKVIKSAIEKYGLENFRKDILETFENAEAMYAREKEVVDADFLLREDTYNLRRGGNGGFDYINKDIDFLRNQAALMSSAFVDKLKDPIYRQTFSDKMKAVNSNPKTAAKRVNTRLKKNDVYNEHWIGRKHSEDTKAKIGKANSIAQAGERNSQFGFRWVNNGSEVLKIKESDLQHYLDSGWIRGRKIK